MYQLILAQIAQIFKVTFCPFLGGFGIIAHGGVLLFGRPHRRQS